MEIISDEKFEQMGFYKGSNPFYGECWLSHKQFQHTEKEYNEFDLFSNTFLVQTEKDEVEAKNKYLSPQPRFLIFKKQNGKYHIQDLSKRFDSAEFDNSVGLVNFITYRELFNEHN